MIVNAMYSLSENHLDFACTENCAEAVKIAVNLCKLEDRELFNNSCTQTYNELKCSDNWGLVPAAKYAQRNDIIYFDWDNSGDCDHVGVITEVSGNTLYYVNFNGSIPHKRSTDSINVNSGKIRAIVRYCKTLQTNTYKEINPVVKKGHKGAIVKLIQAIVKSKTDGMFGNNTENAVKEFQRTHNCQVDGEVGEETFTAMSHEIF